MELESQSLRVRNVIQSISVAYHVIYTSFWDIDEKKKAWHVW